MARSCQDQPRLRRTSAPLRSRVKESFGRSLGSARPRSRAPRATAPRRRVLETVVTAHSGAEDHRIDPGGGGESSARLEEGIHVPFIVQPVIQLDARLEAEAPIESGSCRCTRSTGLEIEKAHGEGEQQPDAGACAARRCRSADGRRAPAGRLDRAAVHRVDARAELAGERVVRDCVSAARRCWPCRWRPQRPGRPASSAARTGCGRRCAHVVFRFAGSLTGQDKCHAARERRSRVSRFHTQGVAT